jgi:hypothetical protein
MTVTRRSLSLLQLLLIVLFHVTSSASDDLWSACDTSNHLYDYKILDKGCMLHCVYLSSSFHMPDFQYLDTTLLSQHSLEGSPSCSKSGHLCVTIVSAKFYDGLIPKRYPTVKFVVKIGNQKFTSDEKQRHPVKLDGRVAYDVHHCFQDEVSANDPIIMDVVGSGLPVSRDKASLLTHSDGISAGRVLRDGKNGTLLSIGDIRDTIIDLRITFTR